MSTEVYQLRTYPVAQQLCGHVEKECRGLCIPQAEINYVNKIINSVYRLEMMLNLWQIPRTLKKW